ncbi:hypothetical protein LRH25_06465 [Ideonella azotifigens]|uniref:Helicase n=1 Tax=Ideonella azotifigens TaxID=513160 RepID=A0ABP3UWD1_9BURK|nr:hypothetical protein [Ideonella azotifigens]MCD2339982.1 hypothetical protein [Ideonella azotifigens]
MATSAKRRAASAPADPAADLIVDTLPPAAKTARTRKPPKAVAEVAAPVVEAAEAPAPAPRKRSRAKPAEPVATPVAEVVEVVETAATAPAPRARAKKPAAKTARPAKLAPVVEEVAVEAELVVAPPVELEPAPAVQPEVPPPVAEEVAPVEAPSAPVAPPLPPLPPRPAHSQLTLQDDGLRCTLRWQSGSRCPNSLLDAVAPLQQAGGVLALNSTDALAALVAEAMHAGHKLVVEDAVWQHLAAQGDLHGRIDHLEAQYPQGLDDVSLPEAPQALTPRPAQLEGAFFLACVGTCLVADDAELEPAREAALAWQLVRRHFGADTVTVLAPAERLAEWQALLSAPRLAASRQAPQGGQENSGTALRFLESPAADEAAPRLLAWNDELDLAALQAGSVLIVDQRDGLRTPLPVLADQPTWCWVLCPADLLQADRAGAEAWLRRIDRRRSGALADWLDGEGDAVLAPLLLQRRFADVAAQWPAWAPQTLACPLPASQRETHDKAQAAALQLLSRWQRSAFLSDSDQLALQRQLQAQQQACREAGEAALPALLQQAMADGVRRVVVFAEDAEALPELAQRLVDAGLPAFALAGAMNEREALLRQFRDAPEAQVLLVADGVPADEPRIAVQPQRPLVILLDRPWDDAVRERRLQRVRALRTQRSLPVWQLLPADSLASRREAQADKAASAEPVTGLRRGAALQAWLAELLACLAPAATPPEAEAHSG